MSHTSNPAPPTLAPYVRHSAEAFRLREAGILKPALGPNPAHRATKFAWADTDTQDAAIYVRLRHATGAGVGGPAAAILDLWRDTVGRRPGYVGTVDGRPAWWSNAYAVAVDVARGCAVVAVPTDAP